MIYKEQKDEMRKIFANIGLVAGLIVAYNKKKQFGGYVGFALLGLVIGSVTGEVLEYVTTKDEKK